MSAFSYLFAAGLLAGAMNALAGGGSFVTLPALIAAGLPSVAANASSTVALWPGGAASAWTYHERLIPVAGVGARRMLAVTLSGGAVGSLLLLRTPSAAFDTVLPWLLLLATLALAFASRIGAALRGRLIGGKNLTLLTQFALGIYGGYFGGAVGLMMVATWSVLGERDLKTLNGPRTLLVSTANTVAVVIFALAGAVRWPQMLVVLAGGLLGGVAGARIGRRVPSRVTRWLTLCCTVTITCAFFARAYAKVNW